MKRVLLAAVVLTLLATCFSGYDDRRKSPFEAHRGTFVQTLVLTGELEAERGALITVPRLPTWRVMIKWLATDGDLVRAGDKVAELDNTTFATDLDTKQQLVTEAEEDLQQKEAEWSADLEQKKLDVEKKLGEFEKAKLDAALPKDIQPARDFENNQTKYSRTKAEYDKAVDTLKSQLKSVVADRATAQLKLLRAQRDVAIAEDAINALVLRAPRDGVFVVGEQPWEERKLQAGDEVWVGRRLGQIPEIESTRVVANLADVDDGRIAPGMPVSVVLDGYPAIRFGGHVDSISSVAQEGGRNALRRAFRVFIKLDRVDPQRMRPGLSARVEVRRQTTGQVLLAPRTAIDFSGKNPRALLASGRMVDIKTGACNAQECVVENGLTAGQQLAPLQGAKRG